MSCIYAHLSANIHIKVGWFEHSNTSAASVVFTLTLTSSRVSQCYKFLAREQGGNDGMLSRNGSLYSQLALLVPIFNSFSQVLYIVCSLKWLPACRSCVQMYPVQCPVSPLWPNSSSEWNQASCQVSLPPRRICGRHFQLPIYNGL